jgi:hypothetical protein
LAGWPHVQQVVATVRGAGYNEKLEYGISL